MRGGVEGEMKTEERREVDTQREERGGGYRERIPRGGREIQCPQQKQLHKQAQASVEIVEITAQAKLKYCLSPHTYTSQALHPWLVRTISIEGGGR